MKKDALVFNINCFRRSLYCDYVGKIDNNKIMRKLFVSLMLTMTAFIANAQPSAIAPQDYQQMLKKGIDVDLSLIHISEPTRLVHSSRMPSSA